MAGRFSIEAVFKAVDRVTSPVTRMQSTVSRFTRSASRGFRRLDRAISGMGRALASGTRAAFKFGAIAVTAVAGAIALLVREFSKIEDAEAAFTPLLGSAARAKELVDALNVSAASTPFQFENLAGAANQLLPVMNGNIEKTIKTLRMLGDTAGGNAQKLDSITRGFTKAMLKGKVDMESLNMIAEAGVPIFTELAESMGVKVNAAFFKMISAGKVTTTQLTKAFEKMTSSGGVFFGGMEIASKTTSGLLSTLKDNISLTAATLGEILAPTVKELIIGATELARKIRTWVTANKELIRSEFIKFVEKAKSSLFKLIDAVQQMAGDRSLLDVLSEGIDLLARFAAFLTKNGAIILKVIGSVIALSLVLKALGIAMAVVNLVMLANPIGLIIVGIAALIAAVAAVIIWWDELKKAFFEGGQAVDAVVLAFALATGPIGWFISAAALIVRHWEPIKAFFTDLWKGIVERFNAAVAKIMSIVNRIKGAVSSVGSLFGFGDDGAAAAPANAQNIVSPQARVARSIDEQRTTSTAEVTIRDESGRAEVTQGQLGNGIMLLPSGAF